MALLLGIINFVPMCAFKKNLVYTILGFLLKIKILFFCCLGRREKKEKKKPKPKEKKNNPNPHQNLIGETVTL